MSRTLGYRIARVGLLLLLGLAAAPGAPAQAAGITVTTIDDKIENDGKCSLREAIIAANTNAPSSDTAGWCRAGEGGGTDTITLEDGATYDLSIPGVGEDASATGDLDILNNSAATDVILNAGGGTATIQEDGSARVLHILGAGVEIDGITITGGRDNAGTGIYNFNGTVTLTNSAVNSNAANFAGGGIVNDHGTVTLTNSTISGNSAGFSGGGIYNDAGTVIVQGGSTISLNWAGGGGGILNHNGTLIVQGGSTIRSNSAYDAGGGIYSGGTLTITGSRLLSNTGPGFSGGLYVFNSTNVTDSCIVDNGSDSLVNEDTTQWTATDNWWGQPGGANTPGADSTTGDWDTTNPLGAPLLTGCSDKLTVQGGGSGSGTISASTPVGEVACASTAGSLSGDCEGWDSAIDGTAFTLVAVPTGGSTFVEWTGCDTVDGPGGVNCHVSLIGDRMVTANFGAPCGLANCSFEGPGGANAFPDSWKRGGVKLNVDGTDVSTSDDGSQSFRFLNPKAKAKKLYQDVVISGPAGANLDLSFSWRGDAVTGKKGLYRVAAILYYTKGGSSKFYVNMPVGTSSNWIEYHLPMTAKKAFKKLHIEINFGKQGAAWFDNFGLTVN